MAYFFTKDQPLLNEGKGIDVINYPFYAIVRVRNPEGNIPIWEREVKENEN